MDEKTRHTIKYFFTNPEYRLSRERYGVLLVILMENDDIDEEIKEEAAKQIQEFVVAYLKPKTKKSKKKRRRKSKKELEMQEQEILGRGHQDEFRLKDIWEDWIMERFHDWVEYKFPEKKKRMKEAKAEDEDN